MNRINRRWRLARRPVGLPTADDFTFEEVEVGPPDEGEIVVASRWISLEPAMRGWMDDVPSYLPPIKLGAVIRANGVGEVVASEHPDYPVGTWVVGGTGIQSVVRTDKVQRFRVINPKAAPPSWHLGILGMTGLTAYFGLFDVGGPREGETVLVSGAAGAVGSAVGQMAKIAGCTVVGIAGGPSKCAHLIEDLGFDAAVDYKAGKLSAALREACPDGIDVFFDNVGGKTLEIALFGINDFARVVLCGAISRYNDVKSDKGLRNTGMLIVRRGKMQGFIVLDYADRYAEGVTRIAGWLAEGKIQAPKETIVPGIETFPDTFARLFSGEKLGKLLIQV